MKFCSTKAEDKRDTATAIATSVAPIGMTMSKVFYTSDLHLGHKKVSEIRGFWTTEEHDAALIEQWNDQVTKHDTVYVLGDIALSNYKYALEILKNLPGRKHLISGNHDIIHPMHERGQNRAELDRWLDVFETVQPFSYRRLGKHKLLLSHFPYSEWGDGAHREGSRYDQFRLPDHGHPLMHGHTHGKETFHGVSFEQSWSHINNQVHVGWDAWGRLVDQEEIIEWLNTTYIILSDDDYAQIKEALDGE